MAIVEKPGPANPNAIVNRGSEIVCTHCGLPVPIGLIEPDSSDQFCCGGCAMAFKLIHANGLDAFYSMAIVDGDAKGTLSDRESGAHNSGFKEFDQSMFLEKFGKQVDDDVSEISLLLDGIHCAACIWLIEKLPRIVPGVLDVKLNWARQTAQIRWKTAEVLLSQIAQALYQLGYTPHPIRESETETRRQLENRRHLMRIGIAAAAAGNNMLIALSLYFGMFSYMSDGMGQLLRVASCLVGLASFFWPGRVFLQGALNAIRTRTPHMDLPIALGLSVGSVAGVVNTIRGSGEIYFDSLSVLIFLLLIGRWIQFRQQSRAADAVEMLYRLTPKTTRRIVDDQAVETFVDLIETGDVLEIRAGDLFPVDAEIVSGKTQVDESILSGESRLQHKTIGDPVLAGTQNVRSVVTVCAVATGRETRLSKIVELVEQAAMDKPEIVLWANRIGGTFVVAVIGLAIVTLGLWLWIEPAVAVDRTVALLIVACPCALALATPLAVSVALGRAAKQRIMIKGGDILQRLENPGMIWLDKTGTLTEGKLQVVGWYGESRWQPLIAMIESKSSHPIAQAIVEYADVDVENKSLIRMAIINEHAGQGISCQMYGSELLIGNESMLSEHGVPISRRQRGIADRILSQNLSPCWIAVDGKLRGIISIGDKIRPDASASVEQLKSAGWEVGILSGDHERIVQQVAGRLGIAAELALGGMNPESKVETVKRSLVEHETVVMVGDGVNDSAAMAAASVGIAVHGGAEASLAAAPVYLADAGLSPILQLVEISKSTGRTMRRNLGVSLTYNIAGATLAILGFINPLAAAILMPISSLTVVAMSLTAGKTTASSKSTAQPGALRS